MMDFSLSVVIPAYNASRSIERTLDSIRCQTYISFIKEIIVINDGSTDNTSELVENYGNKYPGLPIILINKSNGGVSSARNEGMKMAKGSWIGLCDSDDEWVDTKVQQQYEILSTHGEIDFLGGNHTHYPVKILGRTINELHRGNVKELCIKMYPQTSAAIFKKKIFEDIGGYDESRRYAEDGQFFMKICERYKYYYHPDKVVEFDGGKRGFGGSGLSGNLKAMQDGVRMNLRELLNRKSISLGFYLFVRMFIEIKYIRRIVLTKSNKE